MEVHSVAEVGTKRGAQRLGFLRLYVEKMIKESIVFLAHSLRVNMLVLGKIIVSRKNERMGNEI